MVKIIKQWDKLKPSVSEDFTFVESVTDQRAILTSPEGAVQSFLLEDDIMEELEKETIGDFDNDVTDYNERAEFGEDVALARQLEMTPKKEKVFKTIFKQKRS